MYPHSASHDAPDAATPRVLVALHNAREEVRAGHGNALLIVRTLDGLSCRLHAGELLRLFGGVASGARALLRAFDGSYARIQVQRRVAPGVQLRRACIPALAEPAIVAGWCDVGDDALPNRGTIDAATLPDGQVRATVVYLLRVRPGPSGHEATVAAASAESVRTIADGRERVMNVHAWRSWAATVRRQGGAIVLASGRAPGSRPSPPRQCREREQRATHRGALPDHLRIRESRALPTSAIRTLTLHAGRIVRASPDETPE